MSHHTARGGKTNMPQHEEVCYKTSSVTPVVTAEIKPIASKISSFIAGLGAIISTDLSHLSNLTEDALDRGFKQSGPIYLQKNINGQWVNVTNGRQIVTGGQFRFYATVPTWAIMQVVTTYVITLLLVFLIIVLVYALIAGAPNVSNLLIILLVSLIISAFIVSAMNVSYTKTFQLPA